MFYYPSTAFDEDKMLVDGTRIVATLIGMLSIYYAYRLITVNRKWELKKLTELGVTKKTLRNTLIVELSVIFVAALAVALPISNFAVKLVLDNMYMKSQYTVWMVYDYKFSSFILLVILSALALGGAFFLSWKEIAPDMAADGEKEKELSHRYINTGVVQKKITSNSFLTKIFLLRDRKYSVPRCVITVVTVAVVSYVAMYIGAFLAEESSGDIFVNADISLLYERAEEIEDAFSRAEELPYIYDISYTTDYNSFVAAVNTAKGEYSTYGKFGGVQYTHISLIPLDDEQGAELGLYEALVPEETKMAIFNDGKLRLCTIHGAYEDSQGHTDESKELTIVGKCEDIRNSNSLHVYVNMETFIALTGHEPVRRDMKMKVYDEYDVETVIAELGEIFGGKTLFTISNNYQREIEGNQNSRTVIVIVALICVVLMLCGAVLVYVFTSLEAIKNEPMIEKMANLGADKKAIVTPIAYASWFKGIFAYLVGIVLAYIMLAFTSFYSNTELSPGWFALLPCLGQFALFSVLYICPQINSALRLLKKMY